MIQFTILANLKETYTKTTTLIMDFLFIQVKDMLDNCDERKGDSCTGNATDFDGVHLIYAGGHCHAPSCISMELYNADTGRLLCRHDPVYGTSDKACPLKLKLSAIV